MYLKKVNPANPLLYFRNLHNYLISEFFLEFSENVTYDPVKQTIYEYYFIEDGPSWEDYITFDEMITPYLNYNTWKIINFIYNRITLLDSYEKQSIYLNIVLKELTEVKADFDMGSHKGKNVVLKCINNIELEINQKIIPFLSCSQSENLVNQDHKVDYNLKPANLNSSNKVISYKWTGKNSNRQLLFLFQLLLEHGILARDTDFNNFIEAFNEQPLRTPLNIKWLIKSKNQKDANKSSLFYFLKKLTELRLIKNDIGKNEYARISLIFCDFEGKPLKNLKQSKQEYKQSDRPIESAVIDNILDLIVLA